MTIDMTNLSFTPEIMERIISNVLNVSDGQFRFESNYGCGEMLDTFPNQIVDWDSMKQDLFSEYDNLWKELANR